MIHVIFYLPSLVGGGAEKVVLSLIEQFHQKGYKVSLAVNKGVGVYQEKIPPYVEVVDFESNNPLVCFWRFKAFLSKQESAVIIANLPVPNIITCLYNWIFKPQHKMIIVQHNMLSFGAQNASTIKQKMRFWLMRKLYRFADKIVSVSESVGKDLRQACDAIKPDKVQTIYNPVIDDAFYKKADAPLSDTWMRDKQAKGIPVLIMVARFVAQKDYKTIVEAIHILNKRDIEIAGCFLGDGPEKEAMEAYAAMHDLSKAIYMPGFVPNPYPYIKASDMMVHSSAYEGLGLVVIEAMALKTPVLVSNAPANKYGLSGTDPLIELVGANEVRGDVFTYKDAENLADKIATMLHKKDDEKIEKAYKFTESFNAQNAAQKYADIIDSTLS